MVVKNKGQFLTDGILNGILLPLAVMVTTKTMLECQALFYDAQVEKSCGDG
jgi:hypothetical protein